MRGIFIHNPLFRLLFPPCYGLLVYVLVLLIFDSIRQVEQNFFSQEALLCIGLTYALSESLRLALVGTNRLFPELKSVQRRMFIYLAANLLCSLLVITLGVSAYFMLVVGYSSFRTELLTLNIVFLVSTVLYTLVYFGIFYLSHFNQRRLEQETNLRARMEFQINALKADINPLLLYASLENLIKLLHQDPEQADAFIYDLAKIYRYALETKKQDMVPVARELQAARDLIALYNYMHPGLIQLRVPSAAALEEKMLLPGTLQKLVEYAINRSLLTERTPLQLYLRPGTHEHLLLRYDLHERLQVPPHTQNPMPELTRAYSFFTDLPLECTEEDNKVSIRIPLLAIAASTPVAT